MRLLGSHFVFGQTIEEALGRARTHGEFRYSFDMLGEGARTAADAEQYFDAYANAIEAIGATRRKCGAAEAARHLGKTVGAASALRSDLARARAGGTRAAPARSGAHGADARTQFTIDAEEADRLELSLDVIAAVLRDPSLRGWEGFGLAVQAYQKRARHSDRLDRGNGAGKRTAAHRTAGQGRLLGHRDQARAGARACRLSGVHPQGDDRPLLHGLRAQNVGGATARVFPQFATHNALTVASVIEEPAGGRDTNSSGCTAWATSCTRR